MFHDHPAVAPRFQRNQRLVRAFVDFPMSGPHTEPHYIGPLGGLREGLLGFWTYTKACGKDPKRFEISALRFPKLAREQIGDAALYL